jgi:hypothetical protein
MEIEKMTDKITHKIYMKYFEYEIQTDKMTGRKYFIDQNREIIYINEEE